MGLVQRSVEVAAPEGLDVNLPLRRVAELGAEVAVVGLELPGDRRAGAHADIEFLQDVVVHEGQLDVLVAATFAGLGVDLAEQVELRAGIGSVFPLVRSAAGAGLGDRLGEQCRHGRHAIGARLDVHRILLRDRERLTRYECRHQPCQRTGVPRQTVCSLTRPDRSHGCPPEGVDLRAGGADSRPKCPLNRIACPGNLYLSARN